MNNRTLSPETPATSSVQAAETLKFPTAYCAPRLRIEGRIENVTLQCPPSDPDCGLGGGA
jgi:hypothetical protein